MTVLRALLAFLRSYWNFLWTERLGYHRPARDDAAERAREEARLHRLHGEIRYLDLNAELFRRRPNGGLQ